MEPTGPAWLPIAVFFSSRGHQVFRVPSAKAHDMRRYFSRHAKSNGIDAEALAKLAIIDPGSCGPSSSMPPTRLPSIAGCGPVTGSPRRPLHKVRIKDLVRQLLPVTPLNGELGFADLAVLERWADPRDLVGWAAPALPRSLSRHRTATRGAACRRVVGLSPRRTRALWRAPGCGVRRPGSRGSHRSQASPYHRGRVGSPRAGPGGAYQSTPKDLPGACPGSRRSAVPCSSPPWARRPGSPVPPTSAPSPVWPPKRPRPATPTAKARPCPRRATPSYEPPWFAPPTAPGSRTLSWPGSTTSRWPNGEDAPRRKLCRRGAPGRTGLVGHATRYALRPPGHRRLRRHSCRGQSDHRRALQRHRRDP